MGNTIWVMSAKFAPGHFTHLIGLYQLCRSCGLTPSLLLDPGYTLFLKESPEYDHIALPLEKEGTAPDTLLIYNQSLQDLRIIGTLRKRNPVMKVILVIHEPWNGYRAWLSDFFHGREALRPTIAVMGRYVFARLLLPRVQTVLLPSQEAFRNYQKICARYNPNSAILPLLCSDEYSTTNIGEKKYFSFVSTATNSHNFKLFLDYVKYKSARDPEALFQIATRSDVSASLDSDLQDLMHQGRLLINHAHSLSNTEINRTYASSNCTWMLYGRSTQSAALCKSFMFGSPVIASDIGSFQEFVDESSGIILKEGYSLEDIDQAYTRILANLKQYAQGARDAFFRLFHYEEYMESFQKILQQ